MSRQLPVRTALGRPLDPAWPTNRAVLILIPLGALAFAVRSWISGGGWLGAAAGVVSGAGVVLGGWALGRELDPDRQATAFVTLALSLMALWLVPGSSLLLLFTVLTLVRLMNRTVGIPPTVLDLSGVLVLTGWCSVATGNPGIAVVGAFALGVDAFLDPGRREAWVAAGAGLLGAGWALARVGEVDATLGLDRGTGLAIGAISVAFLVTLARTRTVTSRCDLTGEPVRPARVRWGMAVALLAALSTVPSGESGVRAGAMVWATLAGVALGRVPEGRRGAGP